MNIQDTSRSLAEAVSNIMAGRSIEKVELTEAKETTVPFEKMNILTPDQWDQVQNFKNFNEKEWKWNAIQKKFIRLKKIKEEDVEEGNEFTAAAAKAKLAGKDEFEFDGKTYPVEIEQDAAEKILGKKESADLEEASATVQSVLKALRLKGGKDADALIKKMRDLGLESKVTKAHADAAKKILKGQITKFVKESEDLEEAIKFWTVTVTKKAGKLFKGQTVDVKASNSAEAIKKGLKQMKVDNPMTVPSGSVDAVLAESLKEADESDVLQAIDIVSQKAYLRRNIGSKHGSIEIEEVDGESERGEVTILFSGGAHIAPDKLDKEFAAPFGKALAKELKSKVKVSMVDPDGPTEEHFAVSFKIAGMTFESVDLKEAAMSQGVKTAATQIYSLEQSLRVGSNLNKGVNKSLEGKYEADFKKMQKAIGDIITVWEEIERDFSDSDKF